MSAIVDEIFASIVKPIMQQILLASHYVHRNITDEDIENHITFLSTGIGKGYVDLNIGVAVVIGEIIGGSAKQLAVFQSQIQSNTSDESFYLKMETMRREQEIFNNLMESRRRANDMVLEAMRCSTICVSDPCYRPSGCY